MDLKIAYPNKTETVEITDLLPMEFPLESGVVEHMFIWIWLFQKPAS